MDNPILPPPDLPQRFLLESPHYPDSRERYHTKNALNIRKGELVNWRKPVPIARSLYLTDHLIGKESTAMSK